MKRIKLLALVATVSMLSFTAVQANTLGEYISAETKPEFIRAKLDKAYKGDMVMQYQMGARILRNYCNVGNIYEQQVVLVKSSRTL